MIKPVTPELDLASLLQRVQRPGRYVGGEWNAIVKDRQSAAAIALCFADVYEAGMSSLEMQTLYQVLNAHARVACERAFTPWSDMAAAMRAGGVRLFTLESKRPVTAGDFVVFVVGHESGYTNVLESLDLAGLPVRAAERDETHPVVMAMGSRIGNPEPMADFIDLFVLGEPEEAVQEVVALYLGMKDRAGGARPAKAALLARATLVPGVYVPGYYHPTPREDGRVTSVAPVCRRLPGRIQARLAPHLGPPLTRPVVPYLEVVNDRGLVEVQRTCGGFCRGCLAGARCEYLRQRPVEEVAAAVEALAKQCGYREFELVGCETGDGRLCVQVAEALRARYPLGEYAFHVPPLEINSPAGRGADERQAEHLAELAQGLFKLGWSGLRLHCVVGRPGQGPEQVAHALDCVARIQEVGGRLLGRRPRIRVEVGCWRPRPHMLFQRSAMPSKEHVEMLQGMLKKGLRKLGAQCSMASWGAAFIETALAMGSRRVGEAIYQGWRMGCVFDGWGRRFEIEAWHEAFRRAGLSAAFYAARERPPDEVLPWSHIQAPGATPLTAETAPRAGGRCANEPCPICRHLAAAPESIDALSTGAPGSQNTH